MKIRWLGIFAVCIFLAACSSATPTQTPSSIQLNAGAYTPLGGVQKNDNPTTSDFADLQAAESGALHLSAFVEFYADY